MCAQRVVIYTGILIYMTRKLLEMNEDPEDAEDPNIYLNRARN